MHVQTPLPAETQPPRAARRDAVRNYHRIVEAAREVLSESGANASMEEIAARSRHSLLSPTTVPPATMAISACSGSPACCRSRRAEGISRPASAASTSPAAMAANPIV